MLQFACDWCKRVKDPAEIWILGLAAESVGLRAARREVTILAGWDRDRAVHPLAVHFCSEEHKDNYMNALFTEEPDAEMEVETTARVGASKVAHRVQRIVQPAKITVKTTRKSSRRKAS